MRTRAAAPHTFLHTNQECPHATRAACCGRRVTPSAFPCPHVPCNEIDNIVSGSTRTPPTHSTHRHSLSLFLPNLSRLSRLAGGAGLPHGASSSSSSSSPGKTQPPRRPKSILAELADEENASAGAGDGRSGSVKSGDGAAKAAAAVVLGGAALFAAAAVAPPPLAGGDADRACLTRHGSKGSKGARFHKWLKQKE